MNDEVYEAQKARLMAIMERWKKPLGLGYWNIKVVYERDSGEYARKADGGDATLESSMSCASDWRYAHATITANLNEVAKTDDAELEYQVIHEFMHIFLGEVRPARAEGGMQAALDEEHKGHEEHAATMLAKAFLWVRDLTADGEAPAVKA